MRHWISSPWMGLLAFVTVAPAATVPIQIATLACPIPGRAVRPNAPCAPLEVDVSADRAGPIFLLRLPKPIRLPLPLRPTLAPLVEAQVHRSADANPAIPLHPFMIVGLPRLGIG